MVMKKVNHKFSLIGFSKHLVIVNTKEASATTEHRLKRFDGRIVYADLVWKDRLLLEMKTFTNISYKHVTTGSIYTLDPVIQSFVILMSSGSMIF